MKRKAMILAVAALSALAFAATASMATAFETTPAISPVAPAEFPLKFEGEGGMGTLYAASGRRINCESAEGEGSITDAHTGSMKTTLHGCRESTLNSKCTTTGEESGTIVTETLGTHTVYLKPTDEESPHETPGVLFTPNENGKIAGFSCVGGFVKIEVRGNGVLGTVLSPAIGETYGTGMGNVSATEEGQEHTETVEGETYGLEWNTNGGAFEPAYLNAGTETASLAGEAEATTTTGTS